MDFFYKAWNLFCSQSVDQVVGESCYDQDQDDGDFAVEGQGKSGQTVAIADSSGLHYFLTDSLGILCGGALGQ